MKFEKLKNRGGRILMGLLFILLLAMVTLITVSLVRKTIRTKRNKEYVKDYPQKINEYLQGKYGKEFEVNPDFFFYSGSPIPASNTHSPYEFEVWEKEANDDYVFNVWIHTASHIDDKIDYIDDNYCWKFFNMKTKVWFENELVQVLPQEYKFVASFYTFQKIDDSVRPDSPLEYYFKAESFKIPLLFFLIIPPDDTTQSTGISEEVVESAANKFYKNYPNSKIVFYVLQTKNIIDYKNINVKEVENSDFYLRKKTVSVWDIEDIEIKARIEVGELN